MHLVLQGLATGPPDPCATAEADGIVLVAVPDAQVKAGSFNFRAQGSCVFSCNYATCGNQSSILSRAVWHLWHV